MTGARTWPVRAAGLGPVRVGTVLWTLQGQHNVTVLVKTAFRLVPDGPMEVVRAEPLELRDRHAATGPASSLQAVRETAPLLARADVVLYGHAWPAPLPGGHRYATESDVRLEIVREGQPLLDKTLLIYGDRKPEGEPAPFERMPLTYERALGGIGFAANPLGKGQGASADSLPNIVDPADPTGTVGCLGPLPATFPVRRQLLRGESREGLDGLRLKIPSGFDWAYFQCAPEDQRLDAIKGDEWLQLDGLTKEHRLSTRLPAVRAVAKIYGAGQVGVPDMVPLVADLLQIDTDRRRCTLVWRGSFPIAAEAVMEQLCVVGACEAPGESTAWPASVDEVPKTAFQRPRPADESPAGQQAIAGAGDTPAAAGGENLFATVALDADPPAAPATPFESKPPPAAGRAPGEDMPSGGDEGRRPLRPATPFDKPLEPAGGAMAASPPETDETAVLTDSELAVAGGDDRSPFALAAPGSGERDAGAEAKAPPGAPWSDDPAPAIPEAHSELFETVRLLAEEATERLKPVAIDAEAQAKVADEALADAGRRADEEEEKAAAEAVEKKRQAEEKAAAEAEAKRQADAEAEARRQAEAAKFAAEQERAKAEEARRAEQELQQKRKAAKTLSRKIFGGFRRKK